MCHRRNLTWLVTSGTQQPTSLLPKMHFELPFKLIGKSTTTFLMSQSRWHILKPGRGLEQGLCRCFAVGPNQKFSSVCSPGYGFPLLAKILYALLITSLRYVK